jgi:amidase
MSCIGPLARNVDDLELLFRILAGPDGLDSDVAPVLTDEVSRVELNSLRVAIAPHFAHFPVAGEISGAITTLANQLARSGALVEEAPLPPLDFGGDLERAGALIGMMLGALDPQAGESPTTLAQYLAALDQRDKSIFAWDTFFDHWDVLITPPAMVTAFPHCEPGTPLSVDGQEMSYWLGNAHTILFNYAGNPAIVLPYQRDSDGMPIAVQVVGKRWDDMRLLAVARAIAEVTGTFQRPPGF